MLPLERFLLGAIMSKSTNFFLVILLLLSGLAYVALQTKDGLGDDAHQISQRDYLLSIFIGELPNINSKLPHQVDADTVLLSVEFRANKVVSKYELLNNKFNIGIDGGSNKIIEILKKQGCMDETKASLINVDVEFLSRYQDSKGLVILEVLINKPVCSRLLNDT